MPKTKPQDMDSASATSSPRKRSGPRPRKLIPRLADMEFLRFDERDAKQWMSLIEQRGSKDPVFRMADRMQAGLVVTGILTIQGIFNGVTQIIDERGGAFTVEDLNKLTNSFNRAMTSVNSALSYLGVTGNKREEPVDTDALAAALSKYDLEDEIPPGLEDEYISAVREMERADDSSPSEEEAKENQELLNTLKEPLKSHIDTGDDDGDTPDVIDVEKEGLKVL